jgi:hypothetical protein
MADVIQFKAQFVTLDLGDVVLRIKGPTLAQTHELTKVAKALDFSGAITAAKPVFDAARGTTGGGFIGALVAELPTLIPAVADAVGRVAADAMFEAAIALLDTRHNLGRVIRACAVEGADASDLPIDIDSADAVEAPDGTYLEHPGLRRWLRETLTSDVAWRVCNAAFVLGGADVGKAVFARFAAAFRAESATQAKATTTETPTVVTPEPEPMAAVDSEG